MAKGMARLTIPLPRLASGNGVLYPAQVSGLPGEGKTNTPAGFAE